MCFGLLCVFFASSVTAQALISEEYFEEFGGAELTIAIADFDSELLSADIILDHGSTSDKVNLYVTHAGYESIKSTELRYTFLRRESIFLPVKTIEEIYSYKNAGNCLPIMDFYPTYDAYVSMMENWERNYPDLCRIIELGELDSGRKLLVAQIGDNIDQVEQEPDFLLSSTAHGDELAGFAFSLQLIDYLLCNYECDDAIADLMDNVNIFINPLANPDGTYRDDNSTIENPTRLNANNVDLNRNFPDPEDGNQPDNRPRQDETQFMMDFAELYHIDLACSLHGGKEVASYPWGTFERDPADISWWLQTCRNYADTAQHYSPEEYFRDFDNGVTNGFDWFEVRGGRQDYMIYFHRAREFELEMSDDKVLLGEELPMIWEANHRAMINYIQEATYGLQGVIVDCKTNSPILAEIIIEGHDIDSSSVFSNAFLGNYYRYLDGGQYEVSVTAPGYKTLTENVEIYDQQTVIWNVELCPETDAVTERSDISKIAISNEGESLILSGVENLHTLNCSIFTYSGIEVPIQYNLGRITPNSTLTSGCYLLHISNQDESATYPIMIIF